MNARFYVYKNDETLGPYTIEEVNSRLSSGELTPADLFWCAGMADRLPLSKMRRQDPILSPPIPVQLPPSPTLANISPTQTRSSVTLDKLLILGGVIFLFYFYLIFDSTVRTYDGDRVSNLGLMQDRTMGCVISVGAIITGVIMQSSRKKAV